jgi:hypothetical protein
MAGSSWLSEMIYIFNDTLSQVSKHSYPPLILKGLKVEADNYNSAVLLINENKGIIVDFNFEGLFHTESPIKYIYKSNGYSCASTKPFAGSKIYIPAESNFERNNLIQDEVDVMIIHHNNWRIFRPLTNKAINAIN